MKVRLEQLYAQACSIIELVEVAGVEGQSFKLIRKKLLDLGNDILRLSAPDEKSIGD